MVNYRARLNADPLPWLLERDDEQPGVRLFALRWIEGRAADDPQVVEARAAVMHGGPVPAILAQQSPAGWWQTPDRLYGTKYSSSAWQMPFLAELGADPADERVRAACEWVLAHGPAPAGGIAMTGSQSSVVHCLNGIVLRGLIEFGYLDDPRTRRALAWTTDAILGSGEPEYRMSGTSGSGFSCGMNGGLPCAWGAVKELRALAAVPPSRRAAALARCATRSRRA